MTTEDKTTTTGSTRLRTTRIPAPVYAAAGAGDLAYQRLRRLPVVVDQLRAKAATGTTELREMATTGRSELREKARSTTAELRGRAVATLRTANTTAESLRTRAVDGGELDVRRLREAARRNAAVVAAGAQAAQERALAAYAALVARGERVVGSGVVQAADTVNADMEATEAPAAVTATPADVAEVASTDGDAPTGSVGKAEGKTAGRTASKAAGRTASKAAGGAATAGTGRSPKTAKSTTTGSASARQTSADDGR